MGLVKRDERMESSALRSYSLLAHLDAVKFEAVFLEILSRAPHNKKIKNQKEYGSGYSFFGLDNQSWQLISNLAVHLNSKGRMTV
ncbi:MAG: hypothetical protein LBO82_03690 [Synergistaceae bacterium]|jgi:hypothetical protein|nr:hypothetical protein [Synergistaceae bacterium]